MHYEEAWTLKVCCSVNDIQVENHVWSSRIPPCGWSYCRWCTPSNLWLKFSSSTASGGGIVEVKNNGNDVEGRRTSNFLLCN